MKRVGLHALLCLCLILCDSVMGAHPKVLAETATGYNKGPGSEWVECINNTDGYLTEIPASWKIDSSKAGTVTKLSAPDSMGVIKIFAQALNNTSPTEYLNYSNLHLTKQEQGVKILNQDQNSINGCPAYQITWQRPKIKNIPGDLNLYQEVDLIYTGKVYTFILKTDTAHLDQYSGLLNHLVQKFKARPSEPASIQKPPAFVPSDILLKGEKSSLKLPAGTMMFGIFNQTFFLPEGTGPFKDYETSIGYRFELIMTYTDFWQQFPQEIVDRANSEDRIMKLTWQPRVKDDLNSSGVIIPAIINGDYDSYIKDFIRRMKATGAPVFLRIGNEMNGDWTLWCSWYYSKDADLYIDAWRHIYKIIKHEKADNVILVWNPHDRSYPNFKWNWPELYYPGSEYVDWVGLTCYNEGSSHPNGKWRNFKDMYLPVYNEYLSKYPGKPFMIGEFSCNETGGDKGAWITECQSTLKSFPNIRIAVWFDKTEGNCLYRIDSTPDTKEAFKRGIQDPYFYRKAVTAKP